MRQRGSALTLWTRALFAALWATASMIASATDTVYYYVGCYTARVDLLRESIHAKTPQVCIDICEHQTYSYAILAGPRCFCSNSAIANERQDELLCNTRCLADKTHWCGGVGTHSYYSTMLSKEPAPNNLKIINATENSLVVVWEGLNLSGLNVTNVAGPTMSSSSLSSSQRQRIVHFLIRSSVVHSYSRLPFFPQPQFIVQNTESHLEMTDLSPATAYNITVEAMCDDGTAVCGSGSLIGSTTIGAPSPLPKQPQVVASTDTTITVRIPPIRNDNGPLTELLIVVERADDALSQIFDPQLLHGWQKAQADGLPYYVAAQLNDYDGNKTQLFVVGDGRDYGNYTNVPLDNVNVHNHIGLGIVSSWNGVRKAAYTIRSHDQHTLTMDNFTYATFEPGRESVVALTVICIVFAICLALSLVAYAYLRYKTHRLRNGSNRLRNSHEMVFQQAAIERENDAFIADSDALTPEACKKQFNSLLENLAPAKKIARSALRMNVNDVVAEGLYGEVITGSLMKTPPAGQQECQLHVLSWDDLSFDAQTQLRKELSSLARLRTHDHILEFYGVSASVDWFYFVFEHQPVSLKRRLLDSRPSTSATPTRITTLSEDVVLQWMQDVASALHYLANEQLVHKQLCSHNVFIADHGRAKVSLFGPIPHSSNQKTVDISRWLAPESLHYQHYSTASDVWAYGCVAWECCALGGTPFSTIATNGGLFAAMKDGVRPLRPPYVHHDLYQLLLNCWQLEPTERTNFEDIALNVRHLLSSPRHALTFDRVPDVPLSTSRSPELPPYLPHLELSNSV